MPPARSLTVLARRLGVSAADAASVVGALGGGGGGSIGRRRTGRHARCPPFAHDGTERQIVRPQGPAEQKVSENGKKKDHTLKNVLLVNALLVILLLSDTHGGRVHELRLAEATPYPLPAGSRLL